MAEKIRTVAAAALADGELGSDRRAVAAVWDTEVGALKTAIKGSLLQLKDGTWAYVGFQRALVEKESGPVLVICSGGTGKEVSGDWLATNVKGALLGVLCISGASGQQSKLTYRSVPASVAPYTEGGGFKELSVNVNGNVTVKPIDDALSMLGLAEKLQPWGGGEQPLVLRTTPPLPSASDVAAARVGAQALVGGGTWALSRAAKLGGLGWTVDPTGDVEASKAAEFLAALAGDPRLAPALAAALAVKPTSGPTPEADAAVMEAAAAMKLQLGVLLECMAPELLGEVAASAGQMRADGVWGDGPASLGALLAALAARAAPATGDAVSPKTARIQALEAQLSALADGAAAKPKAATGLSFEAPPAPEETAPTHQARSVLEAFTPEAASGMSGAAVLIKHGGAAIVRAIARLTTDPIAMEIDSPLAHVEGTAGEAVAASTATDLAGIIRALPPEQRPPMGRPVDWAEAALRLHQVLRAAERMRAAGGGEGKGSWVGPGGGGEGGARKPPPGSSLTVPAATDKTKAEAVMRAVAAPVLAPIATNEVVWQARTGTVIHGDAVAEARRVLNELQARQPAYGAAVKAYVCSNGMTVGAMAGK